MGHGRLTTPFSTHASRPFRTLALLLFALLVTAPACGSPDSDGDSAPAADSRSWAFESSDEQSSDDTADAGTSADSDRADTSEVSDQPESDTETSPDWEPVRCEDGQSVPAAFEGSASSPAMRVTLYVRDDCGVVGSLAASTHDGNYNLAVRGRLYADGAVSMTGRTSAHHATVRGDTGADSVSLEIDASFDGVSVRRAMSLDRIE